jgi:hypothetical protein
LLNVRIRKSLLLQLSRAWRIVRIHTRKRGKGNVYLHFGLVESKKGSTNGCGEKIMQVSTKIEVDPDPLVN